MAMVSSLFCTGTEAERQPGCSPTHNPPKGGCVVGESNPPAPASDRAAWVRQNLPTCAAVAAGFRAAFGEVRLIYASENGHQIGTPIPYDANKTVSMADIHLGPMAAAAGSQRNPRKEK